MGEGSSINDDEPPIEVPGVLPTVEVAEEDSSIEFLISGKEMKRDQAEGIGAVPVPKDAKLRRKGQAVGTGAPVLDIDRSGEEPDLMEVDPTVRAGDVPVQEFMEKGTGPEPVPEEAGERTGVSLFLRKLWGNQGLLLSQNTLQKHPRVMSRERRGLKP